MAQKIDPVCAVPKDEGWAWICLLGAAVVHFLVVGGCAGSFGVLFKTIQEKFDATATDIAWIPAIMSCVALLITSPVNLICSRVGPRRVVVVGGLLMNIGYLLTAFAQTIRMTYFTYGLLIGSIVVLAPVLLAAELGLVNMPITSGVMYSTSGLFMLGSTVLVGFLRDVTGQWDESFLAIGSLAMIAATINLTEPLAARYGRRQARKA